MHSGRLGESQKAQERRQSMEAKMNANQRGLAVADDGRGKGIGPWGVIVNVGISLGRRLSPPTNIPPNRCRRKQSLPMVLCEACAGLR